MSEPKLDDAEAPQILWDSAEALARDSRRLADAAARTRTRRGALCRPWCRARRRIRATC